MTTSRAQLRDWATQRSLGDRATVDTAIHLADHELRGIPRRNGDTEAEHGRQVALIAAQQGADLTTVVVGILHGIAQRHNDARRSSIAEQFGESTVDLMDAFRVADAARDLSDLGGVDPRALLLKTADRLHNMRTIEFLPRKSQRVKSEQTTSIIAPLATDLGWPEVGRELTQLSIRTLRSLDNWPTVDNVAAGHRSRATARRVLHLGALLLPATCRARWLAEWEGELALVTTPIRRITLALDIVLGMPGLAIAARARGR